MVDNPFCLSGFINIIFWLHYKGNDNNNGWIRTFFQRSRKNPSSVSRLGKELHETSPVVYNHPNH